MRLIDADKLMESLDPKESVWVGLVLSELIDNAPTVDAEPVRHGYWVEAKYPLFTCSECGATYQDTGYGYNYCPNCGAKMDLEKENETN